MDISVIRKYILEDVEINSIINNNIFLLEKPSTIEADNYICLLYKPLSGGVVRTYQLEVRNFGKDMMLLTRLQDLIIKRLDWIRQNVIHDSDSTIYNIELLNGGGFIKDDRTGVIMNLLFFKVKCR